jgi:hypothetical protein
MEVKSNGDDLQRVFMSAGHQHFTVPYKTLFLLWTLYPTGMYLTIPLCWIKDIQDASGGIVNILGDGGMDYSE